MIQTAKSLPLPLVAVEPGSRRSGLLRPIRLLRPARHDHGNLLSVPWGRPGNEPNAPLRRSPRRALVLSRPGSTRPARHASAKSEASAAWFAGFRSCAPMGGTKDTDTANASTPTNTARPWSDRRPSPARRARPTPHDSGSRHPNRTGFPSRLGRAARFGRNRPPVVNEPRGSTFRNDIAAEIRYPDVRPIEGDPKRSRADRERPQ